MYPPLPPCIFLYKTVYKNMPVRALCAFTRAATFKQLIRSRTKIGHQDWASRSRTSGAIHVVLVTPDVWAANLDNPTLLNASAKVSILYNLRQPTIYYHPS